ncbi:MAG TPA: cobalamin-independent methionine synthase II family protein, partial [Chloroflexota bacterium]|nr:cobalamin-independent methionine synthase II family protein [Chloroflexota bacterium]
MTPNYRADHVGSLLRPPELFKAREDFQANRISESQLKEIEDRAVEAALDMQRQVGINVLTDGEYRRHDWVGDFTSSVDGYVTAEVPIQFEWKLPELVAASGQSTMQQAIAAMPQQSGRVIGERLRQRHRLTEHEAPYMVKHAGGVFKVTMPATSYVVARGWKPGVSDKVYGSRWELIEDVARIMNNEVMALASEGVPYVQIDNAHYPDYIPAHRRDAWRAIGIDPDQALDEDIRADNLAVRGLDRSKVTLANHICRGNGRSAWHTEGGYDAIAEKVFGGLDVDRFLLEYDSDRAGGFEPLRFVPKGKTVVLGIVTSKSGQLESKDFLKRRLDDAA